MELSQIRYFLAVANTQHMTKTAEQLHIAQPALSQAIHRLESDLGVPLFVPKGRNIVLTAYGQYLKKRLEPLMTELDSIPEQLQTMASLENETIHLSVFAASTLVSEAIIEFKKTHANVNFQFLQITQSDLYDIGITTKLFYQQQDEDTDNRFVCTEQIYLAVPDNEKYRNRTSIRLEEVKEEGFISLLGSRQLRWICDKFCQHAGFSPRIIFESDNQAVVHNMIASNMGVGFWPEFSWGKVDGSKMHLLEITEPHCQRDILITCRQNKADNHSVEEFFHFLTHYFAASIHES